MHTKSAPKYPRTGNGSLPKGTPQIQKIPIPASKSGKDVYVDMKVNGASWEEPRPNSMAAGTNEEAQDILHQVDPAVFKSFGYTVPQNSSSNPVFSDTFHEGNCQEQGETADELGDHSSPNIVEEDDLDPEIRKEFTAETGGSFFDWNNRRRIAASEHTGNKLDFAHIVWSNSRLPTLRSPGDFDNRQEMTLIGALMYCWAEIKTDIADNKYPALINEIPATQEPAPPGQEQNNPGSNNASSSSLENNEVDDGEDGKKPYKPEVEFIVSRELHTDKTTHLHCLFFPAAPSGAYYLLPPLLKDKFKIGVEVFTYPWDQNNLAARSLFFYLIIPTMSKQIFFSTMLFSKGAGRRLKKKKEIRPTLVIAAELASKAGKKLQSKAASPLHVQSYILRHPEITSGFQMKLYFEHLFKESVKSNTHMDYRLRQIYNFLFTASPTGRDNVDLIDNHFIKARDERQRSHAKGWTPLDYIKHALAKEVCNCPFNHNQMDLGGVTPEYRSDLMFAAARNYARIMTYHDAQVSGMFPGDSNNILTIRKWLTHFIGPTDFPDRKRNLFLIGTAGSGKSVIARALFLFLDPFRVHSPPPNTKYMFSEMQDTCQLLFLNDFRLTKNLPASLLLNIMEGHAHLTLDVKHRAPKTIENIPPIIFTANYLSGSNEFFSAEDISAMQDRCLFVKFGTGLPESWRMYPEINVLASECRYCSAAFVMWLCPDLAKEQGFDAQLVSYFPEEETFENQRIARLQSFMAGLQGASYQIPGAQWHNPARPPL